MSVPPSVRLLESCRKWFESHRSGDLKAHRTHLHDLLLAVSSRMAPDGVLLDIQGQSPQAADVLLDRFSYSPDERRDDAVTPAVLADIYERFLDPGRAAARAQQGIFYTPTPLIDRMCRMALAAARPETVGSCPAACDPSCGAGSFLVRLAFVAPHLSLVGFDQDPTGCAIARFRLACASRTVGSDAGLHKVLAGDAFELVADHAARFSLIVGNPPYVRQERLSDKSELQRFCADQGVVLPARSDLYAYFFPLARQLLSPGGATCFITSDSWLDSRAGEALQRFVVDNHERVEIVTRRDVSAFAQAGVTSAITLCTVPLERAGAPAAVCFRQSVGDAESVSVTVAGPAPGKWGARFLRLPPALSDLMLDPDRMAPLSALASLHYGTKPGLAEFFVLDSLDAPARHIEPRFLRPVLSSTREISHLRVDTTGLHRQLFACNEPLHALKTHAPSAARYVKQAAALTTRQGAGHTVAGVPWPQARSVRGNRPEWHCLAVRPGGDFVVPCLLDQRLFAAQTPPALAATNMFFHLVLADGANRNFWGGLLNCTLTLLMMECWGRAKGLGGLNLYGHDLKQLPIPRPTLFSPAQADAVARAFDALSSRPIAIIADELTMADRHQLDAVVFDALQLSPDLPQLVYDTLLALTRARKAHGKVHRQGEATEAEEGAGVL